MEGQRDIVSMHPLGGTMNIDAIGFNRLAYRIFDELGITTGQVLEDFGKSMIIKKILYEQKDNLSVYGGYGDKNGFVDEMKSMMSELFQYDIKRNDIEDIMSTIDQDNIVYKKLEDIGIIYDEFEKYTGQNYIVAEQLVEMLAECADRSDILKNSYLYFDGFTGFTPVQMKLIQKLMECTKGMVFSFTIDTDNLSMTNIKEHELFYLTKTTIKALSHMAEEAGVEILEPDLIPSDCQPRFKGNRELAFLERNLFRYPYKVYEEDQNSIHITATDNVRQEAVYVASVIRRLVRDKGCRYRDIAIVTGDLSSSSYIYEKIMGDYDIPVFIDTNTSLKGNPCSETIRSLLSMFADNFSYDSVFRFLKAGMTDISADDIEQLENYALKRGLRGYSAWSKEVPEYYAKHSLADLEAVRSSFIDMLDNVKVVFQKKSAAASEYVRALYDFLVELKIYEKLIDKKQQLYSEGRMDEGDAYGQIFEKTVKLFDKLIELIGDMNMSVEEFYEIVDTGLTDIEIGTVPPTVDRVLIGDITRSRVNHIKVLFLVGANDGIIPKAPKKGKILCDRDRKLLEDKGLVLAPSDKINTYVEQFYIYTIMTKPSDKLFITYRKLDNSLTAVRPSYLISRINNIFPKLAVEEFNPDTEDIDTANAALRYVLKETANEENSTGEENPSGEENSDNQDNSRKLKVIKMVLEKCGYGKELKAVAAGHSYVNKVEELDRETIDLLYGAHLNESVSKLETFVRCSFAYYLQYGLGLKEREIYKIDVRNIGTILHEVMEKLFKKVRDTYNNDWTKLSSEVRTAMVSDIVREAADSNAGDFFNDMSRNSYMLVMLDRMANRSADILHRHIKLGTMRPGMIEKSFDSEADKVDKYVFDVGNNMTMSIRGKIDRVDVEEADGDVYIKVIDYKSSTKDLKIEQILSGEQLQLITYSAMAYELEKAIYHEKNIKPAGLLYYSFDDPVVEVKNQNIEIVNDEPEFTDTIEIENNRLEAMKLKGFVNISSDAISRMDRTKNTALPVKLDKDGNPSKSENLINEKDMLNLMELNRENIENIGKSIAAGHINIEPVRNGSKTGCDYCDFKDICHFDIKYGGNTYKKRDNTMLEKYMKGEQ
jgi:ATP-dependent helicase/nuclease subunit B